MADFKLCRVHAVTAVRSHIMHCEGKGHYQQVAYDADNDNITQVCFDCKRITSNQKEVDL